MASSKNYTEVLIGGKVFTLSGFESEDYLQKVSTCLLYTSTESFQGTPIVLITASLMAIAFFGFSGLI